MWVRTSDTVLVNLDNGNRIFICKDSTNFWRVKLTIPLLTDEGAAVSETYDVTLMRFGTNREPAQDYLAKLAAKIGAIEI